MTATIIKFPKHTGSPIRAVHPVDDESELKAAASLLIVAKVADYLVSQSNGRPML